MTLMKQFGDFQKDTPQERNLRYGVREHGMGAIANGITLHSPGFITYCATFFIFTGATLSRAEIVGLAVDSSGGELPREASMALSLLFCSSLTARLTPPSKYETVSID